jgi:general secretion pathway protein A
VAGANRPLFSDGAIRQLHASSGGIPRLVNVIADRALLGAYAQGGERIEGAMVKRAAEQVRGGASAARAPRGWLAGAAAALVLALGLAVGWWLRGPSETAPRSAFAQSAPARPAAEPSSAEAPPAPQDSRIQPEAASAVEPVPQPAPVDTVTPSATVTQSFSEWLAASGSLTDSTAALSGLFEAWGLQYQPNGGPACVQARTQGLRCLLAKGNWAVLERLDRPAVIELADDGGGKHQLALVELDPDQAGFAVDGKIRAFPRQQLDPGWLGDYLVLWSPPESLERGMLRPGDQGAAVLWLRERMAEADGAGMAPLGDAATYDDALVAEVRRFQARQGLAQDGIVGPRTLIQINTRAPSVQGPRLRSGGG